MLESGQGVLRSFHAAAAVRHQTWCKLASLLLTIVGLRKPDLRVLVLPNQLRVAEEVVRERVANDD